MRIPWFTNRETRQDGGYTEALESLIIAQAGGDTTATPDKLAAREIALGLWGRAFASAEVTPAGPIADGIGAAAKVNIARQLLSCGEALYTFNCRGRGAGAFPVLRMDGYGRAGPCNVGISRLSGAGRLPR